MKNKFAKKAIVPTVFMPGQYRVPNTSDTYHIPRFVVMVRAEYFPNKFRLPFYIHRTIDIIAGRIYEHRSSYTITHADTGLAAITGVGTKEEASRMLNAKLSQFKTGKKAMKHAMRERPCHIGSGDFFQPVDIGQHMLTIPGVTLINDV